MILLPGCLEVIINAVTLNSGMSNSRRAVILPSIGEATRCRPTPMVHTSQVPEQAAEMDASLMHTDK